MSGALARYYKFDKTNGDETVGTCCTHGREKCRKYFGWEVRRK